MLFDITNYDQSIIFVTFIISILLLFVIFRNKISNILDPFSMHIFWIAGHISFLLAFIVKFNLQFLPFFFLFLFFFYILILYLNLSNIKKEKLNNSYEIFIYSIRIKSKKLFVIITILHLISKINFFKYIIEHPSVSEWFLYRYVDLQGREPLLRILEIGTEPYFYFFSFLLLSIFKQWRLVVSLTLVFVLLIGIFSGGRSSLLSGLTYFGAFIFFFKDFIKKESLRKINLIGVIAVGLSIIMAIVVTSFYTEDDTLYDGFYVIINRFVAVGDGLEYYMLYNGMDNIKSGINEYFMSIFGIYIKNFTGIEYTNIGTQLTELVVGKVTFAQGANYTFILQLMVLDFRTFPLYIFIIGYAVAKLRQYIPKNKKILPFSFFCSVKSFSIAMDLEYAILCFIAGIIIYVIIVYPIITYKLNKP